MSKAWLTFLKVGIMISGLFAALQLSWPIAPPPNYGASLFVFILTVYVVTYLRIVKEDDKAT